MSTINIRTIAAVATPPGQGAIALLRISGPRALAIARNLLKPFPSPIEPRLQYFGKCLDSAGRILDEALFTYFQGPASFTGEDTVEISCHGGVMVTRCLLSEILRLGANPAEPGEFSQRAFLNGKIDLTRAESIMDMITAQTELAVRAAGEQLAGKLSHAMEALRGELIEAAAHVEAYIDFPDEDIDRESKNLIIARLDGALGRIEALLATSKRGRILREGILTVLCGAPNVGKSSLLNQLVGFDRAIVSQQAGTTRDTIEEVINLNGIPLRVVDTAGLRESGDEIEIQGMARSRDQLARAELVLHLVDSSRPRAEAAILPVASMLNIPLIRILNKSDLPTHPDWLAAGDEGTPALRLSCLTGEGMDSLRQLITQTITGNPEGFDRGHLVSINARHEHYLAAARNCLESARQQLESNPSPEFAAFEIREALESIGAVVGKTDVEEILGAIFSTFCIGK